MPDVCLEEGVSYEIHMKMGEKRSGITDRAASILIDSIILAPPTDELFISQGLSAGDRHRFIFYLRHFS